MYLYRDIRDRKNEGNSGKNGKSVFLLPYTIHSENLLVPDHEKIFVSVLRMHFHDTFFSRCVCQFL